MSACGLSRRTPSQHHRVLTDIVIETGLETAIVDEVHLVTEDLLEKLPEPDEREGRCSFRSLNQQVDIGVPTGLATSNRAENREPSITMLGRHGVQYGRGRLDKYIRMNLGKIRGELQLLAHS